MNQIESNGEGQRNTSDPAWGENPHSGSKSKAVKTKVLHAPRPRRLASPETDLHRSPFSQPPKKLHRFWVAWHSKKLQKSISITIISEGKRRSVAEIEVKQNSIIAPFNDRHYLNQPISSKWAKFVRHHPLAPLGI